MSTFSPTRLQLARERRGLLGKELAALCEVTAQTVSNWESAVTVPAPDLIERFASELRFPPDFFLLPDLDRLPEGAANFRARSKVPARQKRAALAAGDLARELAAWIESRFELPPVRLPDLHGQPPDLAARIIRTEWMLGQQPIPSTIHLLESRGVLVFSLAQDCHEIDAFSFWSGKRPIVLLNTMKSAERSRADAAHELFHLVAHREETGKKEEQEADEFAGNFLMPEGDLLKHVPRVVSIQQLIQIKQRWGVSISALVYRLRKVEKLTDWQYRIFFVELSKRGFRSNEPNSRPREASLILAKVFDSLREQGVTPRRVAAELCWPLQQLHEFLFGMGAAMLGFEGGAGGGGGGRGSREGASGVKRDHMRLV